MYYHHVVRPARRIRCALDLPFGGIKGDTGHRTPNTAQALSSGRTWVSAPLRDAATRAVRPAEAGMLPSLGRLREAARWAA